MMLYFDVKNQTMKYSPGAVDLIADSINFLHAHFSFGTSDWDGLTRYALFKTQGGKQSFKVLLVDGECVVPHEVIKYRYMKVSCFGVSDGDILLLPTNECIVYIGESGYEDSNFPEEPTPDIFQQINSKMEKQAFDAKLAESFTKGGTGIRESEDEDNSMAYKNEAATAKQIAIDKATEAVQSAANALASEENAAGSAANAKISEVNAKDSEIRADGSKQAAAQALIELQNKIGTEIPPLINNAIPSEYLPDETDPIYTADKPSIALKTDLEQKANKVTGATSGNFAGLDANGNLADSGKKAGDFIEANAPITANTEDTTTIIKPLYFPKWDSKGLITGTMSGVQVISRGFKVNDTQIGWFWAGTNQAINITVPTKTSDLTNDSNFISEHQDISGKENSSNKVTIVDGTSTDTQYPSAKCLYDISVAKLDKPASVTEGTNITLADNTEYRITDVSTLTLAYPEGNFEVWMRITTAASGAITITLPATSTYIGDTPNFGNGETWEISIKDGVVVAGKVAAV